jgi:hypothetical protein
MKQIAIAARSLPWLGALVLAGAAIAQPAPTSLPFKANLDLQQQAGRSSDCLGPQGQPSLAGFVSGSGQATHLGAVQFVGFHCLPQGNLPSNATKGRLQLTAANGDTLRGDYTGLISLVTPGVYTFEGNYFIAEGTGRFQAASGSGVMFGTLQGGLSQTGQPFSLTLEGRISY